MDSTDLFVQLFSQLLLFVCGAFWGHKWLYMLVPHGIRRRIAAERILEMLPVIRKEIEEVPHVNLNASRFIGIQTEQGTVIAMLTSPMNSDNLEEASRETRLMIRASTGAWERV